MATHQTKVGPVMFGFIKSIKTHDAEIKLLHDQLARAIRDREAAESEHSKTVIAVRDKLIGAMCGPKTPSKQS